jgi:hypothetical protein
MKNLHQIIYNKLLLQAEEAKELGLTKLASNINSAIGSMAEEDKNLYSFNELEGNLEKYLWKMSMETIKYYDLESVDVEKLQLVVEAMSEKFIEEINNTLNVNGPGPLEPKVPGQK